MQLTRRTTLLGLSASTLAACAGDHVSGRIAADGAQADTVVTFESFETGFTDLVDTDATVRLLSEGYQWSEGPAWDAARGRLYFTDVPQNRAYSWNAAEGTSVFLDPSGVAPELAVGMREPGANGLLMGKSGELLICNHGTRSLEARDMNTGLRRTLVSEYNGKQFNSPNDLIEASDGTIYFTDPPYGLEGLNASPLKEQDANGVYRLTPDGGLTRLVDDMTLPNGITLSPDGRYLYVTQSDPEAPLIRRFDTPAPADSKLSGGEVWFDVKPFRHEVGGLCDGMAVATSGHIFLGGPGGVLVIDPQARCMGRIGTGRATSNCAFGEDGRTLFITAGNRLLAVRTKLTGVGRF